MDKAGIVRNIFFRPASFIIGPRNMYRVSRFLMSESRRDVFGDPRTNGEEMVQATLAKFGAASSPLLAFDIGANVGDWTASLLQYAAEAGKQVRVHAFEPCDATFAQFQQRANTSGWNTVTAVHQACSREPGKAVLNVFGAGSGINSLVESVETSSPLQQQVTLTSVDQYCLDQGIEQIDLLKIDAEGHDVEVILGASTMLKNHAVGILQFEYNQLWIGARRYLRDVFALIEPMGYCIGKLTRSGVEFYPRWHWELETYRAANYIVCLKDWADRFDHVEPNWLPFDDLNNSQ